MTDQPPHHGITHQPQDHGTGHHPRYHGADEDTVAAARKPRTARQRWMRLALIAIGVIMIAIFLTMLILDSTGIGKGLHGHP
jgi:hypothetical protein